MQFWRREGVKDEIWASNEKIRWGKLKAFVENINETRAASGVVDGE